MKRKNYDDYTYGELCGKVKKMLFVEKEIEELVTVEKNKLLFEFNEEGNVVEFVSFCADGSIKEKKRYAYNKGNLKEEIELTPQNQIKQKRVYEYDSSNRIAIILLLGPLGEIKTKELFTRTVENNKIIYTKENFCGETDLRIEYALDSKERVLKRTHYDKSGSVVGMTEYEYTTKGEIKSEIHHNIKHPFLTTRQSHYYFYDEKGRLKQKNTYQSSFGEKTMTSCSYNAQGLVIEENLQILDTDNYTGEEFVREGYCTKWKYDDKNNLVEKTINTTTACSFFYKYDDVGNWVEEREREGTVGVSKIQTVKYRHIEYFD